MWDRQGWKAEFCPLKHLPKSVLGDSLNKILSFSKKEELSSSSPQKCVLKSLHQYNSYGQKTFRKLLSVCWQYRKSQMFSSHINEHIVLVKKEHLHCSNPGRSTGSPEGFGGGEEEIPVSVGSCGFSYLVFNLIHSERRRPSQAGISYSRGSIRSLVVWYPSPLEGTRSPSTEMRDICTFRSCSHPLPLNCCWSSTCVAFMATFFFLAVNKKEIKKRN